LTEIRETEAEPHFSRPVRQITSMLIVLALVAAGLYLGFAPFRAIFMSNPYLNGGILAVFVLGVLSTINQVVQLMYSVQWIEGFAANRVGHRLTTAPSLLAPLATLLRSRGARMQISSSSSRSILDSVAQRIDEDREITRYIGNVLIFLGLLGTFYGLATTVPALVETIRSLSPEEGEAGADVFGRLQAGLQSQLGGMGTAFSSSLLGLAGSLVVGLLELFAGHGQNRFYRELEEWLSTITRLGFAGHEDGAGEESGAMIAFAEHMAEQMEAMRDIVAETTTSRASSEAQMADLARAVERMAQGGSGLDDTNDLLMRVAEGQEALIAQLKDGGADGLDAESRMRLRSIDVQLLRILEEMAAGRQETVSELRAELGALRRSLTIGRGRSGGGDL
jgi:hypothetical protein